MNAEAFILKRAEEKVMGVIDDWKAKLLGNKTFEMRLNITAVPKGRPRFGKHSTYTPERTRTYEAQIAYAARQQYGPNPPILAPVKVELIFQRAIPKSYSAGRRLLAELGWIVPTGGDWDNLAKAVTDAMNKIVYHDDSQIADARVRIVFGNEKKVIVRVTPIGVTPLEVEKIIRELKDEHGKRRAGVGG